MKIMWCGTATLLVESGDTRLLFDPYLRKYDRRGAPFPLEEALRADAVFITHPHCDHFCDIGTFAAERRPVYASAHAVEIARKNGLGGRFYVLAPYSGVRVGALTVTAYPSVHCVFDAATVMRVLLSPRTWRHPRVCAELLREARRFRLHRRQSLCLEVCDGAKRVVILGSAGMLGGVPYPKGADLFVFPYQGRAEMHRVLLPFLDVFLPKKVMIDHFDDAFPPVSSAVDPQKFPAAVKERLPKAEALIPEMNVWYEV